MHMRKLGFLLIIVVLGISQVTILDYLKVFWIKPDLLLIAVVLVSILSELKLAIFIAILCGIFKDIFAVQAFGINTLSFPLWSLITLKLSREIPLDDNYIYVALIFFAVVFNDLIRLIFIFFSNSSVLPLNVFLRITFLESLYTASVSPLIFKFISLLPFKNKEVVI